MITDNLNKTIETLTQDLNPSHKFIHPYVGVAFWFALTLIYSAVMVYKIGLRPDLPQKWSDLFFICEILSAGGLFVSAGVAVAWINRPDCNGQYWVGYIAFGFALALCGVTFFDALAHGLNMPMPHWDPCFEDSVRLSALPAAALVFMTVRGHTTRPYLLALMVMLAVMALSYIGLRFTCMMDTVGHSFFYHILPATVFGLVIGLLARRLFRW
jgi:hypothetical protein